MRSRPLMRPRTFASCIGSPEPESHQGSLSSYLLKTTLMLLLRTGLNPACDHCYRSVQFITERLLGASCAQNHRICFPHTVMSRGREAIYHRTVQIQSKVRQFQEPLSHQQLGRAWGSGLHPVRASVAGRKGEPSRRALPSCFGAVGA